MCTSDKKQDTPARTPSIPVLPPNMLHLGSAAKQQVSGGGNGVSSLAIGGQLTSPKKTKKKTNTFNGNANITNPYDAQAKAVKGMDGLAGKLLNQAIGKQQREFKSSKAYEKQLKIKLSE